MVLQLFTVGVAISMAPGHQPAQSKASQAQSARMAVAAAPAPAQQTRNPQSPSTQTSPKAKAATAKKPTEAMQHEVKMVERMNAERKRFRLRPLRMDFGLLFSARRHARWMSRSGNLQHTTAQVGENIAMGQRSTAEVTQDWMNSPGHRANMLHTEYTRVGAAAHRLAGGRTYWVLQFQR
jgi:uncharacterized protein YkwD